MSGKVPPVGGNQEIQQSRHDASNVEPSALADHLRNAQTAGATGASEISMVSPHFQRPHIQRMVEESSRPEQYSELLLVDIEKDPDNEANIREAYSRVLNCIKTNSTRLDLSGLNLLRVPELLEQCTNLRVLNLSDNQLSYPKHLNFAPFPELRILNLKNNNLNRLPSVLLNSRHLRVLDLTNNCFSDLPIWLQELPSLERLYLSGNQFERMPRYITHCKHLKKLTLADNPLYLTDENIPSLIYCQGEGFAQKVILFCMQSDRAPSLKELGQACHQRGLILEDLELVFGEEQGFKEHLKPFIDTIKRFELWHFHDSRENTGVIRDFFKEEYLADPYLYGPHASLSEVIVTHYFEEVLEDFHSLFEGDASQRKQDAINFLDKIKKEIGGIDITVLKNRLETECGELPEELSVILGINAWAQRESGDLYPIPDQWEEIAQAMIEVYTTETPSLSIEGYRNLRRLPHEIVHLGLEELSVINCSLRDLPSNFGELAQLEDLDLTGNNIVEVPAVLKQLPQLRSLTMDHNRIVRVPDPKVETSFPSLALCELRGCFFSMDQMPAVFSMINSFGNNEDGEPVVQLDNYNEQFSACTDAQKEQIRAEVNREIWNDLVREGILDLSKLEIDDLMFPVKGEDDNDYKKRMDRMKDIYDAEERYLERYPQAILIAPAQNDEAGLPAPEPEGDAEPNGDALPPE